MSIQEQLEKAKKHLENIPYWKKVILKRQYETEVALGIIPAKEVESK